jgi:KDO2-lipid IV(A) lauroyltransferase
MFVQMFPINLNLKTARFMGWLWPKLMPRHLERAMENLRPAFGDVKSEAELREIATQSLQQLTMMAMEVLFTPRLVNQETWPRYMAMDNMAEALRLFLGKRGLIMLTGHYGNWELLGYMLSSWGFNLTAVMRPLDNRYINDYLMAARENRGLRLLYKKGATEHAGEILQSGGALCFIADQNAGRKGVFVDFFGRKASTYKSIGLLAMEYEVPILVGYARRTSPDFEYKLGVQRIIYPEEWADRDDPLRWVTQEYTAAIEAFIREAPEQYLWAHRRWKTRPRDERS